MRNDQVETLTQLSNDALKVRMKPRRALLLQHHMNLLWNR